MANMSTMKVPLKQQKVPRARQACIPCREKKIKCDGKNLVCSTCSKNNITCRYAQKEGRGSRKGSKYVECLEAQVESMRSVLKGFGVMSQSPPQSDMLSSSGFRDTMSNFAIESEETTIVCCQIPSPSTDMDRTGWDNIASLLDIDNVNSAKLVQTTVESESLYNPPDFLEIIRSAMSDCDCKVQYIRLLFDPSAILGIDSSYRSSLADSILTPLLEDGNSAISDAIAIDADYFSRRVSQNLPAKEEVLMVSQSYFGLFNCMVPLYDEAAFKLSVDAHYSPRRRKDAAWWATLNVVLALGHRARIQNKLAKPDEQEKSWGYTKNALGMFGELAVGNFNLMTVQALLGMTILVQGSSDPQPASSFIAAAVRVAHNLGLHRAELPKRVNTEEAQLRRRVFWIAYALDKSISLQNELPTTQHDETQFPLPFDDQDLVYAENSNLEFDDRETVNTFRHTLTLAKIQGAIHSRLASRICHLESEEALHNTIEELLNSLEKWKNELPINVRPTQEINNSSFFACHHVVLMHFSYFDCLLRIYRVEAIRKVNKNAGTGQIPSAELGDVPSRSFKNYRSVARNMIDLLRYVPDPDSSVFWAYIPYLAPAFMALFGHIYLSPQNPDTQFDLGCLSRVINFISSCFSHDSSDAIQQMLCLCIELERIAKCMLDTSSSLPKLLREAHDLSTVVDVGLGDDIFALPPSIDFPKSDCNEKIFDIEKMIVNAAAPFLFPDSWNGLESLGVFSQTQFTAESSGMDWEHSNILRGPV